MTSLALNNNHDIFTSNGTFATVSGIEEIVQELRQNILSIDISDYLENIGNADYLSAAIKSRILSTTNVNSLTSFNFSQRAVCQGSRNNYLTFTARTSEGNITVSI